MDDMARAFLEGLRVLLGNGYVLKAAYDVLYAYPPKDCEDDHGPDAAVPARTEIERVSTYLSFGEPRHGWVWAETEAGLWCFRSYYPGG